MTKRMKSRPGKSLAELKQFPTIAEPKRESARLMRQIRADFPFAPMMIAVILQGEHGFAGCCCPDTPWDLAEVESRAKAAGLVAVETCGEFRLLDEFPETEAKP